MDEPEPSHVPPQLTLYHSHDAPLPSEPPCLDSVDDSPAQMELGLADAPVGAVDSVLTVTVTLAQPVVLQSPSARTWYVVVEIGHTEMDEPEP